MTDGARTKGDNTAMGVPDWDARITLQEAATVSGLSHGYVRSRAAKGDLRTEKVGARLNLTTRRWLDESVRGRGTTYPGHPATPLSEGYQAPQRRGRPSKPRVHA